MTAPRLAAAYVVDLVLGDPEWFPHPVRFFGWITRVGERGLRRIARGPIRELVAGAFLTASVVAVGWTVGRPKYWAWRVTMAWTALATRSLLNEANEVAGALETGDLTRARVRLARIVGRETATLDETEICRALIETLAESACDGIVAPLFWILVGGVSGGTAYKAVNTLDSMIGHKEPPYLYFGRAAARLDDAANYIPARLTALGIVTVAGFRGWRIWLRDGNKHASPNAGQSEAAMAGALGARLGGTNLYAGIPHESPVLHGEGRAPGAQDARRAMRMVARLSGLAFLFAICVLGARKRI